MQLSLSPLSSPDPEQDGCVELGKETDLQPGGSLAPIAGQQVVCANPCGSRGVMIASLVTLTLCRRHTGTQKPLKTFKDLLVCCTNAVNIQDHAASASSQLLAPSPREEDLSLHEVISWYIHTAAIRRTAVGYKRPCLAGAAVSASHTHTHYCIHTWASTCLQSQTKSLF